MESLSKDFERLDLLSTKLVTFAPSKSKYEWKITLNLIPRYLFRVHDLTSLGESNDVWIKSKDADCRRPDAEIDIFNRSCRMKAVHDLRGHLKWKGLRNDNLM